MMHARLLIFLAPFLASSLALQLSGAEITSHHGLWKRRLDRGGAINQSNSTGAQSTQSRIQANTTAPNSSSNQTRNTSAPAKPKLVFAHFIAGLTFDYTPDDWLDDISLAASHGIDAFALNVGAPENWQVQQVSTAYDVATKVQLKTGQRFKMFLSLDMSVIQSADQVSKWISTFSHQDSQLLVDGKVFVSTFSGEHNLFGAANLTAGWTTAVTKPLAALNPPMEPLFVPVWSGLNPNTAVTENPILDGIMTWKAWPSDAEPTDTSVDLQFQADAKKNNKYYMAAVSPCFYTHYADKNWIFRSDDNLYLNRWKQLIAMPTQPDFIQIVSWNDYGESHYIGPIKGSPPNGTNWIKGFDHQAWLDMSDYFIQWYKTGSPPPLTQDKVYYSYRPHSVTATASSDPLQRPTNASTTSDAIYLAAFITSDSTAKKLKVSIGNMTQILSPLNLGSTSLFTVPWNGSTGGVHVGLLDGSDKPLLSSHAPNSISNSISTYNFNYASELLMKGQMNQDTKARAKSGSANLNSLLKPWMSFLGISIILSSYFL